MAKKIDLKPALMGTAGAAVGGVGANFLGKLPFNGKLSNGLGIIAGAAIQAFAGKNNLIAGIGAGLAGSAAGRLIGELVPSLAGVNGFDDALGDIDDSALGDVYYDEEPVEATVAGIGEDYDD